MRYFIWLFRIVMLLVVFKTGSDLSGLQSSYRFNVELGANTSAVQATQLSNEYLLKAVSQLGILACAFMGYIVFEFMARPIRHSEKKVEKKLERTAPAVAAPTQKK
ncbi:hypothetical protein P4V64_05370 [Bacillus thuringiensis]|nr:hypothetical protein [Bacillus thuringiensis]